MFSGTVAANDKYLRALIDNGSATANELRSFLEQNKVNLGQLLNNLVTTNEIVVKHLKGIRQILVIYPYVVAGGFTVAEKSGSNYNARFGLILTQGADACEKGYEGSDRRSAQNTADRPMRTNVGCADPSRNFRGAEKSPRGRTGAAYRSPVATYDASTGKVVWTDQDTRPQIAYDGGAADVFGEDSWKWMLLQPSLARNQE